MGCYNTGGIIPTGYEPNDMIDSFQEQYKKVILAEGLSIRIKSLSDDDIQTLDKIMKKEIRKRKLEKLKN